MYVWQLRPHKDPIMSKILIQTLLCFIGSAVTHNRIELESKIQQNLMIFSWDIGQIGLIWAKTFFSKVQKRHFCRLTSGLLDAKNQKNWWWDLWQLLFETHWHQRLTAGFIRTCKLVFSKIRPHLSIHSPLTETDKRMDRPKSVKWPSPVQ